jgi:hypothetical protein
MFNKKCTPFYMAHPIACGMVLGLSIIGFCGVVMAMKQKSNSLGKAVKRLGADCVCKVEEVAENAMEEGIQAIEHLKNKTSSC